MAAKLEPGKGRNTPLSAASLVDVTVPQPVVSSQLEATLNDPQAIDLLDKFDTKVRGPRSELDLSNFPGQGVEHRSDRANEVAQNTNKNPNLTGSSPGQGGGGGGTGGTGGGQGGGGGGGGPTGAGSGLFLYYYHPDHLGSTQFVSTQDGSLSEHVEYIPFGETWVDEGSTKVQSFLFTSKELDTETGLYYFGARYYDPRTSLWVSADPIIEKYLPNMADRVAAERREQTYKPEESLAGQGGVYDAKNLALYAYGHDDPEKLIDPDGKATFSVTFSIAGGVGLGGNLEAGVVLGFSAEKGIQLGTIKTVGVGGYGGFGGGISLNLGFSGHKDINELSGPGLAAGGSAIIAGADVGFSPKGEADSFSISLGLKDAGVPVESHALGTVTSVKEIANISVSPMVLTPPSIHAQMITPPVPSKTAAVTQ